LIFLVFSRSDKRKFAVPIFKRVFLWLALPPEGISIDELEKLLSFAGAEKE
jgi:hypothetical protein